MKDELFPVKIYAVYARAMNEISSSVMASKKQLCHVSLGPWCLKYT